LIRATETKPYEEQIASWSVEQVEETLSAIVDLMKVSEVSDTIKQNKQSLELRLAQLNNEAF
jgi:hypothetical protein